MERFLEVFGTSERTFKRDLKHVREIAKDEGFTISPLRGGLVTMTAKNAGIAMQVDRSRRELGQLLAMLARVLGEPVGRRLGGDDGHSGNGGIAAPPLTQSFLHFAFPALIGDRWVADVYEALEAIWRKGAYARFRYPKASHAKGAERIVEPCCAIARSGRYYLIAYDRDAKGWRYFALDQILSKPQAAGTMVKRRELPAHIRPEDVIGMIIGDEKTRRIAVTVELAPRIARSVLSRRWQGDQETTLRDDGTGRIVLKVSDPDEVIRWTFGFGGDARVVAPADVAARAAAMLREMAADYGGT